MSWVADIAQAPARLPRSAGEYTVIRAAVAGDPSKSRVWDMSAGRQHARVSACGGSDITSVLRSHLSPTSLSEQDDHTTDKQHLMTQRQRWLIAAAVAAAGPAPAAAARMSAAVSVQAQQLTGCLGCRCPCLPLACPYAAQRRVQM